MRPSVLAVALCLCVLQIGCGGDSPGSPASSGQWIYYASNDGTNGYVNRVRPDGSSPAIVVTLGPNYQGYASDGSGAQVAFGFSKTPFTEGATYALCVGSQVDIDSVKEKTAFLYDSIGSIQFTTDGSKVLYTAAPSGQGPALFRLDLRAMKVEKLDDGVDMQISPNGLAVLYTKAVGSGLELFEMAIGGAPGSGVQLTSDGRVKQLPSWSDDGSKIAYVGYQDAPPYVGFLIDNNGKDLGTQPKVKDSAADVLGLAFSPDVSELASVRANATDATKSGVFKTTLAGGGGALVASNPQVTGPVFWSDSTASANTLQPRLARSLVGFAHFSLRRSSRVRPAKPR